MNDSLKDALIKALRDKYGPGHPWDSAVPDAINFIADWQAAHPVLVAVPPKPVVPPPGPPIEHPPKGP
jgi:hypothetical protein